MLKMMERLPDGCVKSEMKSPVGVLTLIASADGLRAVIFENDQAEPECRPILRSLKVSDRQPVVAKTRAQLSEYFAGERSKFDIPLIMDGTPFQKLAWKALLTIPYGKTISYGEQARRLGDAAKARAVGGANSRNPISIIVPCHRVIGKSGALTGFGGGLGTKEFLLNLERKSQA
jgi:methylated-DNA-[protein]-cysteine S-methyltransferase